CSPGANTFAPGNRSTPACRKSKSREKRYKIPRGGIEMRAIIVRESIPVLPSGPAPSLAVVYDGDLAAYEGGLGMYDEGDAHVWRTAIVNLTPHEIVVRREDGSDLRIPPSGVVARVTATAEPVGTIAGVPVVSTRYGEIECLPAPRAGVQYIVS